MEQFFYRAAQALWVLGIAAQAFLVARLAMERLIRSYPIFYTYLTVDIVVSLGMINIDNHSFLYTVVWSVTRPLLFAMQCLTVYELHRKVCEHYPGVTQYRRKLALATAVAATAACLVGTQHQAAYASNLWVYYGPMLALRIVNSAILVFLVLLWGLFRILDSIGVERKHNVVLHLRLLTTYFGINCLCALLLMYLPPVFNRPLSTVMLATDFACLVWWCFGMTRAGEVMPPQVRLPYDSVQIEASIRELRYKLRALNPTV